MNKQGIFFSIALVFIALGALVSLILVVNAVKTATEPLYHIGERSFEITQVYAEGEKVLFFVDQSAKISASKALEILATNGGFSSFDAANKLCRTTPFRGYVVWNSADLKKLCSWNHRTQFIDSFKALFFQYLDKLAPSIFSSEAYDFSFIDDYFIGISSSPIGMLIYSPLSQGKNPKFELITSNAWRKDISRFIAEGPPDVIPVKARPGLPVGQYFIRPSFKAQLQQDLSFYDDVKQTAKQTLKQCALPDFNQKIGCVHEQFAKAGFAGIGPKQSALFTAQQKGARLGLVEDTFLFIVNVPKTPFQIRFALFIPFTPTPQTS